MRYLVSVAKVDSAVQLYIALRPASVPLHDFRLSIYGLLGATFMIVILFDLLFELALSSCSSILHHVDVRSHMFNRELLVYVAGRTPHANQVCDVV
jgi:hypothetical protein